MIQIKNRDLKQQARELLTDHHGFFALVTFLLAVLDLGLARIPRYAFPATEGLLNTILYWASFILISVVSYLILAGAMRIYLCLCRQRPCFLKDLLFAFSNRPEQVAVYAVLQFVLQNIAFNLNLQLISRLWNADSFDSIGLYAFICPLVSLLLLIIHLGLSMVLFIYCDAPYKNAGQLIKESWQIMRGNKLRLFGLRLSFLGILILGILSFGIGFLFIRPYIYVAEGLFYLNLPKRENDAL